MNTVEELRAKIAKIRSDNIDIKEQHKAEDVLIKSAALRYSEVFKIDEAAAAQAVRELLPARIEKPQTLEDLSKDMKRVMSAVKMFHPRLVGLETREGGEKQIIAHFRGEMNSNSAMVRALDERVGLLNLITKELLQNKINDSKKYYRVIKISYVFKTIFNKIKNIFKINKKV